MIPQFVFKQLEQNKFDKIVYEDMHAVKSEEKFYITTF